MPEPIAPLGRRSVMTQNIYSFIKKQILLSKCSRQGFVQICVGITETTVSHLTSIVTLHDGHFVSLVQSIPSLLTCHAVWASAIYTSLRLPIPPLLHLKNKRQSMLDTLPRKQSYKKPFARHLTLIAFKLSYSLTDFEFGIYIYIIAVLLKKSSL